MIKDSLITHVQMAGQHEARASLLFRHFIASKADLHPTDMECLEVIVGQPQVTPGLLSKSTGLSTGATTAALTRLERKKYITRTHSTTDRRKVIIAPVAKNVAKISALYMPFVNDAAKQLEQYTQEQLETILQHYQAMAAIYEAQTQQA